MEAAYLKSWDVYADAVYDLVLDEEALAEVYAEEHLDDQAERDRASHSTRARQRWFASTTTTRSTSSTRRRRSSSMQYRNHQVLIDPETKEPIEDDPNERCRSTFTTCKLIDGGWRVDLRSRSWT